MSSTTKRVFHAPGDWLANSTSVRDRRSIATWFAILYVLTLPLRYPLRNYVSMVWALSEGAIIISLLAWGSAETPVETE
jgi:hypothetical protein